MSARCSVSRHSAAPTPKKPASIDAMTSTKRSSRRAEVLTRQGVARNPGDRNDDYCYGRNDLRLDCRLADYQRADDGHRVTYRVRQAQTRLLKQLK